MLKLFAEGLMLNK